MVVDVSRICGVLFDLLALAAVERLIRLFYPGVGPRLAAMIGGKRVAEHRAAHIVELDSEGFTWIKSSYSGSNSGGCVELTAAVDRILVRCSRDRHGSRLSFPRESWLVFLAGVPREG